MSNFGELSTTTIRDFSGGLNVVQDDLNMNTSYSTIETNMYNSINGTKAKRYGTKFFKNVKSYPQITETFDTCDVIVKKTVTIPQDTIHEFDLTTENFTNKITITYPENLAGTYNIPKENIKNTTFLVYITTIKKEDVIDKVTYYINENTNAVVTTDVVYTLDGILQLPIYNNKNVTAIDKIYITAPTELVKSDGYSVTSINETNKTFTITIDSALTETTAYNNIKYTTKKDDLTQRFADVGTVTIKNTLQFKVDTTKTKLLIGHKITVEEPTQLAGTYNIIERDATDYSYYIDITAKNVTTTQNNVKITHNNRSITGNRIINCDYYINKLILVSDIGEVIAVDGLGNGEIIWNNDIAKYTNINDDIVGWHNTDSVSFAVFNGILTIWNGRDKPLAVDFTKNIPCNYLIDEGTGSNANVPIAKYALAFNHYLVCGNILDDDGTYYKDRISISARDTIGTFYDPTEEDITNDGVYVDLGKIISTNKQEIKGLSRFRNQVVVGFDDVLVLGTLGQYVNVDEEVVINGETQKVTKTLHEPKFEDVIDSHGCVSNRTFAPIKSELVCLDYSGIPLLRKQSLTTQILPARISTQITPDLFQNFINLYEKTIEDRIFSVVNPKDNQYLLFIPNDNEYSLTTETICYAYTMNNEANSTGLRGAWSKFTGWNFQCGCTTALNEVFLIDGTKLYTLGNIDNPYYADFIDDPDYPAQYDEDVSGKAIDFEWEFPWIDFGNRAATKHTRYISLSSTGIAKFKLDLFLDYIYYNDENKKDPQLSLEFVGGSSVGFGNGRQLYGGSRRTNSEFLFAYPAKFKIAKLNLHGSSKHKLNINGITIYYQVGNIRR